ncbi:G-type lectin S-receptor-like serine/threonine-protein kinase, partial [Mucuna pruriens]
MELLSVFFIFIKIQGIELFIEIYELGIEMNPKISDFGLARSFGGNEIEANTKHVVGTYGYLPLEYIIDGAYSTKSDVFSFGVLISEIVSGKRNKGFCHQDNLLAHAWRLFSEGKCSEIVDATMKSSLNLSEVLKTILVGLLCVQLSFTLLLFCLALLNYVAAATVRETINTLQEINDGQIIVSPGKTFALGFFSPGNSKNRYVGIWYNKVPTQTLVWVANRNNPLTDSSGVLKLNESGVLVILNHNKSAIWSSNTTRSVRYPVAKLLDSGNLIVQDGNNSNDSKDLLWQSFDYPVDTILPGQKFGRNLITGLNRYMSSWNSSNDPSQGEYSYQIDISGYPQLVLRKGSVKRYRFGSWNGIQFSGAPQLKQNAITRFSFVSDEEELYFRFELTNKSIFHRMVLTADGNILGTYWNNEENIWSLHARIPVDDCDYYDKCGAYAICNINNIPPCNCLDGFVPKTVDLYGGCERKTSLSCNGDGFLKFSGLKLPDTERSWFERNISLEDCRILCMKNCSCTAYAALDVSKGPSGCLLWFNDLIDIRELPDVDEDIYIRMAGTEIGNLKENLERDANVINEKEKNDLELPMFELSTITSATNNFSTDNKLGEGGFGSVYKGSLDNGGEIAVKRLSKTSSQGHQEFKNEVMHIAKLQHRNLVRLLGYCIQEGERLLVYEFMPNKSLDSFIFDEKKSMLLDWPRRLIIINGIARGLLYLHQDSRHRIVHRDLKAGNVLLDSEMNPKISDFGLARSFGGNEIEATTKHVVGTYGYLPPEYIIDGAYSTKSDVFSFDWPRRLLIINGIARGLVYLHQDSRHRIIHRDLKAGNVLLDSEMNPKISDFGLARSFGGNETGANTDHVVGTYGYMPPEYIIDGAYSEKSDVFSFGVLILEIAWRLFTEGKCCEIVDATIRGSLNLSTALRSIHVGLLCVQLSPDDRPNMSSVVLMLGSESALPHPKLPGFFTNRNPVGDSSSSSSNKQYSNNDMTVSILSAR